MSTRVLLIEDDEDDYLITRDLLSDIKDGRFELKWTPTFEMGRSVLEEEEFEVCLVDYHVGERSGLELIQATRAAGCLVPMILLTGVGHRDIDIAAMRAGAADFLEKGQLTPVLLERAIRYAISQSENRQALIEKSALLRTTLDNSLFPIRLDQRRVAERRSNPPPETLSVKPQSSGRLGRRLPIGTEFF